jgi:hypothetical protein
MNEICAERIERDIQRKTQQGNKNRCLRIIKTYKDVPAM